MTQPNKALSQAAQDVPPEPSPGNEDPNVQSAEGTPPVPGAGDPPGDSGAEGDDKSGRTLDNVRGEFDRKLGDFRIEMSGQLGEMKGLLQNMSVPANTPPQPPNDAATMSSVQLEQLRPSIPEDKLPAFDQLLVQRRSDERTTDLFEEKWANKENAQVRTSADQEAYSRYPDLHNQTGRLFQETNRVLNEVGDARIAQNPRAVLDAANEAAARLGVKARTGAYYGIPSQQPGVPPARTAPAPDGTGGGEPTMTLDKAQSIAKRLAGALPSGKFTKEQLEGIQQQHGVYKKHQHLIVKQ